MVQNNLENQIKQKLDARQIQPSAQSWDRLDAMLTVAENKSSKRKINWLAIAAVFIGFTIIGFVYFNKTKEIINPKNEVVLEKSKVESSNANRFAVPNTVEPRSTKIQNTNNRNGFLSKVKNNNQEQVVQTNSSKIQKQGVSIINNNQNQNQVVISQNTENVVLKTEKVVNHHDEVNVEALLASVNQTDTNPKPTLKVNASNLLNHVDNELTQTFREKVISKAARNYQSVKVALADRNIQK